jgi:1,4-dihydroxy-2-naphthoyl-CoA synthase
MAKTMQSKMVGSVPKKTGSGSGRKLDHKGCGSGVSANNAAFKPTTPASGKAHGGYGAGAKDKYKNPGVKTYAQGPQGKQAGGY